MVDSLFQLASTTYSYFLVRAILKSRRHSIFSSHFGWPARHNNLCNAPIKMFCGSFLTACTAKFVVPYLMSVCHDSQRTHSYLLHYCSPSVNPGDWFQWPSRYLGPRPSFSCKDQLQDNSTLLYNLTVFLICSIHMHKNSLPLPGCRIVVSIMWTKARLEIAVCFVSMKLLEHSHSNEVIT
jgi:hypothetical protein